MLNGMDPAEAKQWFGVMPPDLSLIARSKGSPETGTFMAHHARRASEKARTS
jgi:cytochrome c1